MNVDIWPIVADRLTRVSEDCNSYYIQHQLIIIRGLIWGMTGKDPGVLNSSDDVLKYFPGRYHIVGDEWFENELYENGKLKVKE